MLRNLKPGTANSDGGPASQTTEPRFDPTFLRLSAGSIYFFLGALKFFPDLSPAEMLAGQSVMRFTFHILDANTAVWLLALMECAIGLSFLLNMGMKYMFFVFLSHQAATFLPLFMFPELTFKFAPFAPTMEGQYIMKNLISVAAGWTVMLPAVKASWAKKPREAPVIQLAEVGRQSPDVAEPVATALEG